MLGESDLINIWMKTVLHEWHYFNDAIAVTKASLQLAKFHDLENDRGHYLVFQWWDTVLHSYYTFPTKTWWRHIFAVVMTYGSIP